ncbi:Hsp33 family molecular chaperone HslO [Peptoniphilus indolicus]|uniref:33 kDa chaperonin n=2 Tax=Peptoniphilus indolicus TaxID=33030 RepID=G4D437_9FIRM|nr:Hsp33 family molecular chaperone HslO [Peptoniphilus indolicus]EGY79707.1 chaperonin HslO [Peptoniphilus indolicus ATCC 29427]SUB75978.1 Heat shock protein 33 homolog [Peptoniphilus indolicus]
MDYLVRAIDKDAQVRIFACSSKNMVEKSREIHNTSKTATAALGRSLTAAALMSENLKNEADTLTLNIKGDGDIGQIVVTAKANGIVKGYVNNPMADADIRESDGKLDVGKIVGKGTLTVVADQGLKEPYIGKVELISGEIAEDLANYFYRSDQVPSVVSLGVLVDVDYSVKAAGGFILQLMPGADDECISKIEQNISKIKSITSMLDEGMTPEQIVEAVMSGFEIKILDKKGIGFNCDCSFEKVEDSLISLGKGELKAIIEEDGRAEVMCHFCNSKYNFSKEELTSILESME